MILLFYKYVDIQNPEAIRAWQRALCEKLRLTGRIIFAHEGINGTVAGSDEACQEYIKIMDSHELFGDIDFKTAQGDATAFPKLKISVKEEIVRLGVDPKKVTVKDSGQYLTPEQTHHLLQNPPKNLIIIDTRNDYEWAIGRFKNAITPPTKTFREFPEYVDKNLDAFKDKEVLMYCTGGVRCERATAYVNLKGVAKKVYHIQGGIQRYTEQYPDGFFRGSNYVFDSRVNIKINDDILSTCALCTTPWDQYINCKNALCNKHFLACPACVQTYNHTCSQNCQTLVLAKQTPERSLFPEINSSPNSL